MKNIFLFTILLFVTALTSAQNNPRPTTSRFFNSKQATFTLKAGDILVYEVNDGGRKSDLIITIKDFNNAITYDFSLPSQNRNGTVTIPANHSTTGASFNSIFYHNENFTAKTLLWLSEDKYKDLASSEKQTKMNFDSSAAVFTRQSTSTQKINFKGKERIITVYNIDSEGDTTLPGFSILTELNNRLVTRMDGKINILLKEVR